MFIKIFILKKVKLFHDTKDIKNDAVNRNYLYDNGLHFEMDVVEDIIKNKFIFLNHKIDFGEQINWNLSEDESKSRLGLFTFITSII